MSIIPLISEDLTFIQGNYIQLNEQCVLKLQDGKCRDFYKDILTNHKIGWFICPKTYSVYSCKISEKMYIFTGLRMRGVWNGKNLFDSSRSNNWNPVQFQETLEKLIFEQKNNIRNEIDTQRLHQLFHEVKGINSQIKAHCENVMPQIDLLEGAESIHMQNEESISFDSIINQIRSICISSSLVYLRFLLHDMERDNFQTSKTSPLGIPIYRKFDKIQRILRNYNGRRINFTLSGTSYLVFQGDQILEFLPFCLLENAAKYSPIDSEININFKENNNTISVDIFNWGPLCTKEELQVITKPKTRGAIAKTIANGEGLGLYLVQKIIDMHENIHISFNCDNSQKKIIDNKNYAVFHVTLLFNNCNK